MTAVRPCHKGRQLELELEKRKERRGDCDLAHEDSEKKSVTRRENGIDALRVRSLYF